MSHYFICKAEKEEYDCQEDGLLYYDRQTVGFPDGYEAEITDTWQKCQKKCAEIEACKGFTWHNEISTFPKSCSLFSKYGWKGESARTVSGQKDCPSNVWCSFQIPSQKVIFSFSAMVKEISIKTGKQEGAEKIAGDVFALISATTGKECMTHLLTNYKGVDRSSPGKVDHYRSENQLGSRVRKSFQEGVLISIQHQIDDK